MHYRRDTAIGVLALTLAAGACNRQAAMNQSDNASAAPVTRQADRAAELQRQRDEDLAKLDARVAALERDYQQARDARPSGTAGTTATSPLRGEAKSDVHDVTEAVEQPPNHDARKLVGARSGRDEACDRRRRGGRQTRHRSAKPADSTQGGSCRRRVGAAGQHCAVHVESRQVRRRHACTGGCDEQGPRHREGQGSAENGSDDLHARVNKLGEDLDRLKSASAEDWWDVSKGRVEDYIARVEKSVHRIPDQKK